jgi:uncharacterized hydrophobic protein (TIGR00271 family)
VALNPIKASKMDRIKVIKRYLRSQFNLIKEEENEETYAEIMEGARLKGYNFWILGFAMIIACVGLNVDSTSAVIGAMLISPLMGPIVALAFGIAVNNQDFKRQGIRNWLMMTGVSLFSSVLFFIISPFDNNTNALLSFQKATIFDIILAFFGGMAGFIGIIKKEGTKVIAGVAVATACMPPLCTAGYGIAHLDYAYFIGGLYFYLINCLFIGLATFLTARFTGYHENFSLEKPRATTLWLWYIFIVLMILPSLYIAYTKWQDAHVKHVPEKTEQARIEVLEEKVRVLDSLLRVR